MNKYRKPLLLSPASVLLRVYGYSLVELMITLAVAAVLLAAATPSFTSMRFSHTLTNQANEMVGILNFARSEAIRRNTPVRLCRATSEFSSTCVTTTGNWQHWIVLANGSVIRRGAAPANSGLTQTSTLTTDTVTFGADGLARTNNTLTNDQYLQIDAPIGKVAEDTRRVILGAGSRINVKKVTRKHEEADDDEHG